MKKLVLFGAGKIGRSFIGQLFATSGFEVVFIDISEPVINELNRLNEYKVVIKSSQPDEIITVSNVRGILGSDADKVAEELSECDLVAISVGQKGLPNVIYTLAKGLILRKRKYGRDILNTIIGNDYPVDELVGLVETSIGKMVPIMPKDEQGKDLLIVYAE